MGFFFCRYYNWLMLGRREIKNQAVLRPRFTKYYKGCPSYFATKRHAYAPVSGTNKEQCLDCGKIRLRGKNHGLH